VTINQFSPHANKIPLIDWLNEQPFYDPYDLG